MSANILPRLSVQLMAKVLRFFSTSGEMVVLTLLIISIMLNSSRWISIFPASTLERSRISLIKPRRYFADSVIFWRSPEKSLRPCSSDSSSNNSLYPMMAFMGVRNSWLMVARNRLLARLASCAWSRARASSVLARWVSAIRRTLVMATAACAASDWTIISKSEVKGTTLSGFVMSLAFNNWRTPMTLSS